jgi:hypothetical protein
MTGNKMIEYKLFKEDNSPITFENVNYVNNLVVNAFPGTTIDTNRMGEEKIRKTYGVNGSAFHIYYRYNNAEIFIPEKYNSSIKNKLESTGLKCR